MSKDDPCSIPKPRFQAAPKTKNPGTKRKPLPRHILKQILDASNARLRWRDPMLLEMQARVRATKPERDKARSLRREARQAQLRKSGDPCSGPHTPWRKI